MRYVANSYSTDDVDCKVTDAVLTDEKFSLDFETDGSKGTMIANSKDGFRYSGFYEFHDGYRGPCTLRKYVGKDGSVLMAGDYHDETYVYKWFIGLELTDAAASSRPKKSKP